MDFWNFSKTQKRERLSFLIKDLIEGSPYTQTQVSEMMGWSRSHLSNIIHGRRNLDFFDWGDLCRVLEVSPSRFLEKLQV